MNDLRALLEHAYRKLFGGGQGAYAMAIEAAQKLETEANGMKADVRRLLASTDNPVLTLARNMQRVRKGLNGAKH